MVSPEGGLSPGLPWLTLKTDKTPLTCGRSTTPQQWEDYSRYNKERADAEMQASNRLREAIHHTLQQTANDLEAQKIATEYAFRRRIHEFERAKDELEWQKKNVSCQILFIQTCLAAHTYGDSVSCLNNNKKKKSTNQRVFIQKQHSMFHVNNDANK